MARMVQVPFGHAMINRLAPDLGPEHYKTYEMSAPLATHWRPADCATYECEGYINGFVLAVDIGTDLGKAQFEYCTKKDKTRSFTVERHDDRLVHIIYGPGNECFDSELKRSTHRVPVGRPPFYLVSGGDWRGNPRGTPRYVHRRPEDWVDDFANHQDKLAEAAKKG